MVFDATLVAIPERPGQHIVLQNPRPGTGTDEALEPLMSRIRPAAIG